MLSSTDLENAKHQLFATRDLEQLAHEANSAGAGHWVMLAINATLESLKQHAGDDPAADVEKLCTAYNAYRDASKEKNSNGVCAWGTMLLEAQESLNIRFFDADLIRANIEANRR